MTEDVNGGAEGNGSDGQIDDAGEQVEQPDQQDQGEGTPGQQEAVEDTSDARSRVDAEGMEDDRFATTIRFRGELAKPSMTGEGSEDELTVKIKVAGFDLADLHHSLRPYAGRVVEAIILPIKTAEEKAPWETPDPDQQQLGFEGDRPEGELVCAGCGRTYDMATEGTCPECGGVLNPREQISVSDDANASGDTTGDNGQEGEEGTPA